MPQAQRESALTHLESGGIKLVIVHPEVLPQVQVHRVSALVLEEAQSYLHELELQSPLWCVALEKFVEECNPDFVHVLAPALPCMTELAGFELVQQQGADLVRNPLTASRDEDLLKQMAILFRSPRLFKKSGILVYCYAKGDAEEVQTFLVANGFKSCVLSNHCNEQKRQALLYDFAKQAVDILVLTSGLLLPEGFKNYVYLTVHVNIPLNVETLLYDISELNPQANSHVFLNPTSFLRQRNEIIAQAPNIKTIDQMLQGLFKHPNEQAPDASSIKTIKVQ